MEPILKWAGGKRWLVPELRKLWKPGSRLVEPFCGGLSVSLGLMPTKALLNDVNPYLVNFYKEVQDGLSLSWDPIYSSQEYYNLRDEFNRIGLTDKKRSAELFYYLNRTCFNGLCRFNKSGGFNVPFGKYTHVNYQKEFPDHTKTFQSWDFHCGDFSLLVLQQGDFVYCDPPYDVEFTKYYSDGFTWEDQVRLVDFLDGYSGPVILSNQKTSRILSLYKDKGYTIKTLDAPRTISSNGNRDKAEEVLAWKGL